MKKGLMILAVIAMVFVGSKASATNYCWNMSPFIDNIELAVTPNGGMYELHGVWRVAGGYNIVLTGTATKDPVLGGTDMGLSFQDNLGIGISGSYDAKLGAGLTGPWFFIDETSGFTNTGTLVPIACPIPDVAGPGGRNALGR